MLNKVDKSRAKMRTVELNYKHSGCLYWSVHGLVGSCRALLLVEIQRAL